MMIDEAIVLAGGLGTRLQTIVKDTPKPMAEVAGKPFLDYIMSYLYKNSIRKVVLAVGYKYEVIQAYFDNPLNNWGIDIKFSIENEPLGTGGGIYNAFKFIEGQHAFVINGDTYFDVPLQQMVHQFEKKSAEMVFALKKLQNAQRYGSVKCADDGRILSFSEKVNDDSATINGGIYIMKKLLTERFPMSGKFSIEEQLFQNKLSLILAYGEIYPGKFIDIGIPEDFNRAQTFFNIND